MNKTIDPTAMKLLKEWACSGRYFPWLTTEYFYGKGPKGGRISGGMRDYKAAERLAAAGYLKLRSVNRSAICDGGYTSWSVVVKYDVTESGIALANALTKS